MSWFNINVNESLNTLKGQITNVSNVVHDVFTEGILEEHTTTTSAEEAAIVPTTVAVVPVTALAPSTSLTNPILVTTTSDDDILIGLEEANKKIDELNSLCETKDNEIVKLRQHIELLSATTSTDASGQKAKNQHGTEQPKQQHQQQQPPGLEDSWFWESEKTVSSDSSKENDGGTAAATVKASHKASADDAKNLTEHPRIVDNLRRTLDEKDVEIQRLLDENLNLNEKIKHLYRESIEQDKRLDELDQQHTEALQNLVLIKNELQQNVATLKTELDAMRDENATLNEQLQSLTNDHSALEAAHNETMDKFKQLEVKHSESIDESGRKIDELHAQLNAKSTEIGELNAMLEEKDAHSRDGSDKFELIDLEKEKMTSSMEINRLQTELDEINERLAILKDIKDQYDSNVVKLSSVVSEKSTLEEQVKKLTTQNQQLLNEMHVARESVEKLEDDDLVLQEEFNKLRADKEQLESARSIMDEQIIDLERNCTELDEKLSQSTQAYAKLQSEHGECAHRINELQTKYDTLKTKAVDLESSLVEENMKTQKQVIDLQSALNSKCANELPATPDAITFDELKAIVSKTLSYETSAANNNTLKLYLDAFLRSVKETYQHLSDIESNRDNLMKQFETVSTEKVTLQHEYKTLKADLHHYENEVAELMKNNGILLNQLENLKAGKLETILEHNEDSVLRLETQLEDTNELNASLQDQYTNLTHKLDESEEEKYEMAEQIATLQQQLDQMRANDSKLAMQKCFDEKIQVQNDRIAELTKQLDDLRMEQNENGKLLAEIEQLKLSKQSTVDALHRLENDYTDLQTEFKRIENELATERAKSMAQIDDLNGTIEKLQQYGDQQTQTQLNELQQKIEVLSKERHELVTAVQVKHNENIQYHAKIQELNQMTMTLQQNLAAQRQQLDNCAICVKLTEKLTASHNEITHLTEQVTCLKEKSEILSQNLVVEQNNQKMLAQEKIQLNEEKQSLAKDLNRLREHLIEMENAHTAEMIELQNMLELTRQEMAAMQEDVRKSNTAYTSASIRANQHTETIQAQYAVLQQQKDELSARLSEAEDRESKNKAALINLQCVLEQFQKDKERDVESMTNRIRNELNDEFAKRQLLLNEIESLKSQLQESKAGLLAAARISDQLEIAQVTNATIKEELRKTQDKLHSMELKLHESESNQADRVDKSLLKNLLIGYIMAPNNDKQQILKLISSVLDFNQIESDKVGLNRTSNSWLNSILHGPSSPNANQTGGNYSKDSLAEAFVKFLEAESRPRSDTDNAPSLLSMNTAPSTGTDESNRSTMALTTTTTAAAGTAVQPILLPDAMLQTFTAPRNSSSILKDILNDS